MLAAMGVRLLGRLTNVQGSRITLTGSAARHAADGDAAWRRMTALIDTFIDRHGLGAPAAEVDEGCGPVGSDATENLDLTEQGIATVLWCTGFTGDFSFTDLPLVDDSGRPIHDDAACPVPGIWIQGYPWLTQRRSGILYGFPLDAEATATAISRHLVRRS